jgi:hypothetical protein
MGMRRLDLACLPRELPTTLRGALVRSLRTRHPGCFIVLLGSASQPITVAASSITEIDAFLPRPWKRSEMLAVLAACQARRAVHEPGSQNRVS